MTRQNTLVAWLAYPAVMALCIALHYGMLAFDWNLQIATYLPITLGALLITLFELKYPYRGTWAANRSDITNDVTFMVSSTGVTA